MQSMDTLTAMRKDTLMERTKREEEFRRKYEETEKYNLTSITSQPDVNGLIFYRPTRGMISDHFDAEKRHMERILPPIPMKACLLRWMVR